MNNIDEISKAYDQRFRWYGVEFTWDDVLDICAHLNMTPGKEPIVFLHNCGLRFKKVLS